MRTNLPLPVLLLLHEGGWDEVMMIGAGLLMAYFVIMWTGRRSDDDDVDEDEDADELQPGHEKASAPADIREEPPQPRG